jgi:hypothetical protein
MNKKSWIGVVLGSGIGAWWWSRRRRGGARAIADRGTVIFDNTPLATTDSVVD